MGTRWLNIDKLFEEENIYRRGNMNKKAYDNMCSLYNFVKGCVGWVGTKKVKKIPNMGSYDFGESSHSIRCYFDHYYSFKNKDGDTYWVVCPYDCGKTRKEVIRAFEANGIKCNFLQDSIYADFTIVIKPEDLVNSKSYYKFGFYSGKYSLCRFNPVAYNGVTIVATFKDIREMETFKAGYEFCQQGHEILDMARFEVGKEYSFDSFFASSVVTYRVKERKGFKVTMIVGFDEESGLDMECTYDIIHKDGDECILVEKDRDEENYMSARQ